MARFAARGVTLTWDAAALALLAADGPAGTQGRAWERYLDTALGPLVADRLDAAADSGRSVPSLRATVRGRVLMVEDMVQPGAADGGEPAGGAKAAAKAPEPGRGTEGRT